ncbi:MAG: DUF5060 domain-containing protein [Planctomycetota bacterium]|nr:DUF5060 domain-containing protein [Planctomycetota bacterium]
MKAVILIFALAATTIFSLPNSSQAALHPVEQWDVLDISLPGPTAGNPFINVTLSAQFTCGQDTLTVPGFYDGDGAYRIRFSPPEQGQWKYLTTSNSPQLQGKAGSFNVTAPTGSNHGPVLVHNTFHFAYADGTPYFQVGTTCYAWTHQPDDLEEQTLKTLADSPFNKIRMCIFPKSYLYNTNDPPNYPFTRGADGKFDFTRFDPANWQHLERRIADLRKLGIEADLILFHPYDRWGFSEMDPASDDRYLRYAIARLSAYRNVWWSLANEYDFMIPPLRKGQRGNKTVADFDRFFSILQKEDPYNRQRSVHYAAKIYDNTKAWVTHTSIQNRDLTKILGWREKYQKPIVVDECRYEGNIAPTWGNLTGPQMVHQFWVGTICGGYVGHGETLKDPNDILWWSKGGVLHGQSPPRIAFLRKTMEALPYWEMTPSRPDPNVFVLAKAASVYLVYALKEGPIKLKLEGDDDYTVEALDTWNMTATQLDSAKPGEFNFAAPRADFLLRITAKK